VPITLFECCLTVRLECHAKHLLRDVYSDGNKKDHHACAVVLPTHEASGSPMAHITWPWIDDDPILWGQAATPHPFSVYPLH
jgi:hypothetical protein